MLVWAPCKADETGDWKMCFSFSKPSRWWSEELEPIHDLWDSIKVCRSVNVDKEDINLDINSKKKS